MNDITNANFLLQALKGHQDNAVQKSLQQTY